MNFLKLTSFGLMSTFLLSNICIVNATENRIFLYGTNEFNIQCSHIKNGSRELSQTIDNAFEEMCCVDLTKGYQGHIVLNHDNRNILLSRYSLMQEEGNCGFDALSLNRKTFGDLFINAFSTESWTKYSEEQKYKLSNLLYGILIDWQYEFSVQNGISDVCLQSQLYDPSKYFDVLSNSVNVYIKQNRPDGSKVSDLNDKYIGLISYILGINIVFANQDIVDEFNVQNCIGKIFLYNTGNHWHRCIEDTRIPNDILQSASTDKEYINIAKNYDIKSLLIPKKFTIISLGNGYTTISDL